MSGNWNKQKHWSLEYRTTIRAFNISLDGDSPDLQGLSIGLYLLDVPTYRQQQRSTVLGKHVDFNYEDLIFYEQQRRTRTIFWINIKFLNVLLQFVVGEALHGTLNWWEHLVTYAVVPYICSLFAILLQSSRFQSLKAPKSTFKQRDTPHSGRRSTTLRKFCARLKNFVKLSFFLFQAKFREMLRQKTPCRVL